MINFVCLKKYKLVLRLVIGLFLISASPVSSFSDSSFNIKTAKKLLAEIHAQIGHQVTLYCECPYVRVKASGGNIDRDACGLRARKNEKRSDRVEWEHVLPASWIGGNRSCWQTGHANCVTSSGKKYKGRKCCTKKGIDPDFIVMYSNPHNLFPSGGEVNGDRRNYPFGTVEGELRQYGACDFEVGGNPKVAEPKKSVHGEVARAMLYMIDTYGISGRMSKSKLLEWHQNDPPEEWEIERAKRIEEQTGFRNPYISR